MRNRNFQARGIAGTFLLAWLVCAGVRAGEVPCEVVLRAVDIDSKTKTAFFFVHSCKVSLILAALRAGDW